MPVAGGASLSRRLSVGLSGAVGCAVYAHRPSQCRTWPFWPYPLASRQAWERVKRMTPGPGMDRGPLRPVPEPETEP